MRAVLAATLMALLLASPVIAQNTPTQGAPAPPSQQDPPKTIDDAVKRSPGAAPGVAPEGTRAPTLTDTPMTSAELQQALERVWNTSIDLQGNPSEGLGAFAVPQARGAKPQ